MFQNWQVMVRIYCLLAASLLIGLAESMIWEFGQDSRSLSNIAQYSGRVKPLEKVKKITLPVPTCMEIKYVWVNLYNEISTPAVTYDKNIATVTISYKLLQSSWSSYDIVARGRRSRKCSSGDGGGVAGRPGKDGGRPGGGTGSAGYPGGSGAGGGGPGSDDGSDYPGGGGDYHGGGGDDGSPGNEEDYPGGDGDAENPANVGGYSGGPEGTLYPENGVNYPGVAGDSGGGGDNVNSAIGSEYLGDNGYDEYVGDYKD